MQWLKCYILFPFHIKPEWVFVHGQVALLQLAPTLACHHLHMAPKITVLFSISLWKKKAQQGSCMGDI